MPVFWLTRLGSSLVGVYEYKPIVCGIKKNETTIYSGEWSRYGGDYSFPGGKSFKGISASDKLDRGRRRISKSTKKDASDLFSRYWRMCCLGYYFCPKKAGDILSRFLATQRKPIS